MERFEGEIEFVHDTLAIEDFTASISPLTKEAGLSDALGGIVSSVKSIVMESIDTSSPGAFIKSILKLLEPSIMFRVHPLFGIMDVAARSLFNFSLTDLLFSVVGKLKPKIEKGQQLTPEEVNQATKSLISTASPDHLLADLSIIKEAIGLFGRGRSFPLADTGGAALFPTKGTSLPLRMFGFLGAHKFKTLALGFVGWFIKSILASVGLLAGGAFIASLFGKDKKSPLGEQPAAQQAVMQQPQAEQTPQMAAPTTPQTPTPPANQLTPSGRGSERHSGLWIVPVYGDVKSVLLDWATEVYSEFDGHEDLILSSPSFNRVADILESYLDPKKPNYLVMPEGIQRKIDVVDMFAADVAKKLPPKGNTK